MARPGFIDARKERDAAFLAVRECEQALADVETLKDDRGTPYTEGLKAIHRKDHQKALDFARERLTKAEQAFSVYDKPVHEKRKNFETHLIVNIAMDGPLYEAVMAKRKEGIALAELVRQALVSYLQP